MKTTWNTDIYCLIGHPVSKTLSPIIHNNFYRMINTNNIYLVFDVKKNKLQATIEAFKTLNVKGFNVTLPYKTSIMEYLDLISDNAKIIGAVNTVRNENGRLIGYNTDGIGFIESLKLQGIDVKGKNILLLGAGGVAKSILVSLCMEKAQRVFISNRTLIKAKRLSKKAGKQFSKTVIDYGDLKLKNVPRKQIDMVINCTSIGMYPDICNIPIDLAGFSKDLIVYDTIYKPNNTEFMKLAQKKGYYTMGGLSMLINQALCSQDIWIGKRNGKFLNNFEELRRILQTYVE